VITIRTLLGISGIIFFGSVAGGLAGSGLALVAVPLVRYRRPGMLIMGILAHLKGAKTLFAF